MKKGWIVVLLLLVMFGTQAQDYFVSFAGSGDTTTVGAVQVVNLSTFDTIYLNGGDTLYLITWGVGVGNRPENTSAKVYPNPMTSNSILEFEALSNGNAEIIILNVAGRRLYSKEIPVKQGANSFSLSGLSAGAYVIKITGRDISCSTKVLSKCNEFRPSITPLQSSAIQGIDLKSSTNVSHIVEMTYNTGDRLQYRGASSTYKNLVTEIPASSKTVTFHFLGCFDNSGHYYETVEIAPDSILTQTWMAENLNTGEFRNENQGQYNNSIIEKYCYQNDLSNCSEYGGLYKWNEMMQYDTVEGVQGVCPEGWRLPTDDDWTALVNYYGGPLTAGGAMKEAGTNHWLAPNAEATNETGFSALPGGDWSHNLQPGNTHWCDRGTDATYWNSTRYWNTADLIWNGRFWSMQYLDGYAWHSVTNTGDALSVRCVHD
jgi:uncharacterized protein (TIGR02145 family)